MAHIKWLDIESFRGIENLQLDDARQINILVGENNTGKTSILEAISLWEYPLEIYNFIKVARNREMIISPSLHSYSLMAYDSFLNLFNKNQHEDMGLSLKTQIDGEKLKGTMLAGR